MGGIILYLKISNFLNKNLLLCRILWKLKVILNGYNKEFKKQLKDYSKLDMISKEGAPNRS